MSLSSSVKSQDHPSNNYMFRRTEATLLWRIHADMLTGNKKGLRAERAPRRLLLLGLLLLLIGSRMMQTLMSETLLVSRVSPSTTPRRQVTAAAWPL